MDSSGPIYKHELAFRNDLSDKIAVFVRRQSVESNRGNYGQFIASATYEYVSTNPSSPRLEREVVTHAYEIPPAAAEWSDIAVLLWDNGIHILETLSTIAGAAEVIRFVIQRTHNWIEIGRKQKSEALDRAGLSYDAIEFDTGPEFFLSQSAICVLVLADFVERFGYQEDLSLAAYPRGIHGYNDPSHPNGTIRYLIECCWLGQAVIYIVDARANVTECFMIRSGRVRPLDPPNLLRKSEGFVPLQVDANGLEMSPKLRPQP